MVQLAPPLPRIRLQELPHRAGRLRDHQDQIGLQQLGPPGFDEQMVRLVPLQQDQVPSPTGACRSAFGNLDQDIGDEQFGVGDQLAGLDGLPRGPGDGLKTHLRRRAVASAVMAAPDALADRTADRAASLAVLAGHEKQLYGRTGMSPGVPQPGRDCRPACALRVSARGAAPRPSLPALRTRPPRSVPCWTALTTVA